MDGKRTCTACGGEFPATTEHFILLKNKKGWSGLSAECRACRNARFREWYIPNRERQIARAIESTRKRRARPEVREQERVASREAKRRQLADPVEREKHNERQRQWYKDNPGGWKRFKHQQPAAKRLSTARRHAAELQATPPWLSKKDRDKIECIYIIADFLTQRTGVQYDVDHVHPLRGLTCCGLHVPWNLRVITAAANQSKGNRLLEGA